MTLKIAFAVLCCMMLAEGRWRSTNCDPAQYYTSYYHGGYSVETTCKISESESKQKTFYQDEALFRILNGTLTIELLTDNCAPKSLILEGKLVSQVEKDFANIPSLEWFSLEDNLLEKIGSSVFDGLPELVHLNLARNRIQYLDRNSFQGLIKLRVLNLNNNRLKNTLSFSIAHSILPKLKHLYLNDNQLEGFFSINDTALMCNTSLTHLYLSSNSIRFFKTSKNFDDKPCLKHLTHLYLENNQLRAYDLGIENIQLEALALDGNKLLQAPAISPSVKYLSLARNLLSSINDPQIPKNNIAFLVLSYNRIGKLENQQKMDDWPSLQYLGLDHNYIPSIPNGFFSNLSSLRRLDLTGNKIDSISSKSFENLTQWQGFYLGDNYLTKFPSHEFHGHITISHLDLSYNNIKNVADLQIDEIPNIKTLKLTGNPIKRIDVESLPSDLVILF